MIWNTILIVSCWPFVGPPVQDAWGQASAPPQGHPCVANGPCLWHSLILRSPSKTVGDRAFCQCPDNNRSTHLPEVQWLSLQLLALFAQCHSLPFSILPLYTWLTLVSLRSLTITCWGEYWILKYVSWTCDKLRCPGIFGTSFPHA